MQRRTLWGIAGAAIAISWAIMLGLGTRPHVIQQVSVPTGVARTETEVVSYDPIAGVGERRVTYFEADGEVLTSIVVPFETDGAYPYLVYPLVGAVGAGVAWIVLGVAAPRRRAT